MNSSNEAVGSSASNRVLVIMAKAPRPRAVKPHLIPGLSPEAVTAFSCCLLEHTLALTRSLGDVKVSIMCPGVGRKQVLQLAGKEVA